MSEGSMDNQTPKHQQGLNEYITEVRGKRNTRTDREIFTMIDDSVKKFDVHNEGIADELLMYTDGFSDIDCKLYTLAQGAKRIIYENPESRELDEREKDLKAGELFDRFGQMLHDRMYPES